MEPIRVLVPVADRSEEIEVVVVVDTLRRADIDVTVAAVGGERQVTCSRDIVLVADALLSDLTDDAFDAIVLPGGMPGAEVLRDSVELTRRLRDQDEKGRLVAAICAAPAVVLQHHRLVRGRAATCHPAFFDQLDPISRREDRVVVSGNLVTSRGPGTALEFALALVERLRGPEVFGRVAAVMLPAG